MKNTEEIDLISPAGKRAANGFGSIARQASIRFSGMAFDKLIGYAFALFVANYYGTEAFGLYLFGVGIIEVLIAFSRLGMERAELRAVAHVTAEGRLTEVKGIVRTSIRLTLPVSLVLVAAVFIFIQQVAILFGKAQIEEFLRFAAPAILISTLADMFLGATEGQGDQRFVTLTRFVIEPLIRLSLAIVFNLILQGSAGDRALALSYSIAVSASAVMGYWFYRKRIARRAQGEPTGRYAADLLKVGLPFCGITVLNRLLARAEIFLLFAFVSAAATAEYTLAQRTALLTMMIALAADAAFRPTIARAFAKGQYDQAASQFMCVSRSILMVCLPACLLLALFPARVMAVIGEQFTGAAPAVTLITIGTIANFTFGPVTSALAMAGLTQKNLRNGLIAGAIGLTLDLTLIPQIGIVGGAIAQSVSMTALAALNAFSAYRATGVIGIGRTHLKLVVASAVAALAGLVANNVAPQNRYAAFVIIATAVFSGYGATLVLIKPAPEDLQLLKSIFIEHDK